MMTAALHSIDSTLQTETAQQAETASNTSYNDLALQALVHAAHSFQLSVDAGQLSRFCPLDNEGKAFIRDIEARINLSARGQHRLIKTARTIADLESSNDICLKHLREAALYRGEL